MGFAVDVPDEPAEWSCVLDRGSRVWQRRGSRWYTYSLAVFGGLAGALSSSWEYLLVDHGPLTPLVTEDEAQDAVDAAGWASLVAARAATGDVFLSAGDAAWLNVLIDNAVPSGETGGPMDWEGKGRAGAKAMLGFGDEDAEALADAVGVLRTFANPAARTTVTAAELTDDQRDDALAASGQAIDYRAHDERVEGLKRQAGACASQRPAERRTGPLGSRKGSTPFEGRWEVVSGQDGGIARIVRRSTVTRATRDEGDGE